MEDYADQMQSCNNYIEALEEERRKIQVFQRELPLCLELVTRAIDSYRQQLSCAETADYFKEHEHEEQQQQHEREIDFSEETSSDGPVLEDFIPIKQLCSSDNDNDMDDEDETNVDDIEKSGKKSDWLRSVQLWNQSPDTPPTKNQELLQVKKKGGAFSPFNKEKKDVGDSSAQVEKDKLVPMVALAEVSSSAAAESSRSGKDEDKQGESKRKQRRCWSPELHRRFLNSLQQLGGAHVATPKQIREFMKVDGLTNDEVKSHLQKYRLHTRRPSSGTQNNNGNQQAPQFLVVGGIWVQPSEYNKMGASTSPTPSGQETTTGNEIYAPVAAPPLTLSSVKHKLQAKDSHSEEWGNHSTSPATSSCTHTHTTAASLVF